MCPPSPRIVPPPDVALMTHQPPETFYCLFIHDLLQSQFDPETRVSTWRQLKLKKVDILGIVVSTRTYEKRSEYDSKYTGKRAVHSGVCPVDRYMRSYIRKGAGFLML